MAILLEIPTSGLPFWINPAKPFVVRDSGHSRVTADVVHDATQVVGVADDAVEAFLLPEFTGLAGRRVDVFGGDSLHRSNQVFEFVSVERSQNQVAVVGHDDPAIKLIPFAVKVMQPVTQIVGPASFLEVASSVTFIGPRFRAANDLASMLFPVLLGSRFGMSVFPMNTQIFDLSQLRHVSAGRFAPAGEVD